MSSPYSSSRTASVGCRYVPIVERNRGFPNAPRNALPFGHLRGAVHCLIGRLRPLLVAGILSALPFDPCGRNRAPARRAMRRACSDSRAAKCANNQNACYADAGRRWSELVEAERGGLADLARRAAAESSDGIASPIRGTVARAASVSASELFAPPSPQSAEFERARSVPLCPSIRDPSPADRAEKHMQQQLADADKEPKELESARREVSQRASAKPPASPELASPQCPPSNPPSNPPSSPPPHAPLSAPVSPRMSAGPSEGRPLHHSELAALKQRFRDLDASGRGVLSRSEFYQLFNSVIDVPYGVDGSEESPLFDFAYNLFDSAGGEGLDLKEFISGCWILMGSEEERIRHLFHMYDKDNSGSLNIEELQQVFRVMRSFAVAREGSEAAGNRSIGIPYHRRHESEKNMQHLAERALSEQDNDGDGQIGFEDFQRWCANDPIVKVWMDMLSHDTARGIARLREENEKKLLAKELNEIGLMDKRFWQESLSMSAVTPELSGVAFSPKSAPRGDPYIATDFRLGAPVSSGAGHYGSTPDSNTDPDIASSANSSMSRVSAHPSRDTTVGSFEIEFNKLTFERRIGEGSFAEVYSGRWLDSPVAIKVFKSGPRLIMNADGKTIVVPHDQGGATLDGESFDPALASTIDDNETFISPKSENEEQADGRIRFMQEVSLLTSLRHPHVLLYIGACVEPKYPLCIVSELIDGGSLHSLLHGRGREKLSLAQKLKLTQDIARGMFYLHSRTPVVLHRDLKSANILVERQQNDVLKATIIDFGLSKLSSTEMSLGPGRGNAMGLCGSLVTMAPEIMARQNYVAKSDVYSFGIIVWEIFTGRVPFRGLAPGQLVLMVSTQRKRPPFRTNDHVPDGIRTLIEACWEHEIDDRLDFLLIIRQLNQVKRQLDV